jgi:hypothetical protein
MPAVYFFEVLDFNDQDKSFVPGDRTSSQNVSQKFLTLQLLFQKDSSFCLCKILTVTFTDIQQKFSINFT